MKKIKSINSESFHEYGWVIEFPEKESQSTDTNLFKVVIKENTASGWRIAYLVLRDKSAKRLESHPDSFESFEPVSGKTLIFLAASNDEDKIECFRLNKPVVLKKGIWHAVITLCDKSEIKITENAEVECVFWNLNIELNSVKEEENIGNSKRNRKRDMAYV